MPGAMVGTRVALNGVDPEGDDPPDEVFIGDGENRIGVIRSGDGWILECPICDSDREFDSFDTAFARASLLASVTEARGR